MDPITQKIISLTKTPEGEAISSVFQTYAWAQPDNASTGAPGVHTSRSSVDMTKGGMVMGKRWDTSADWYVTDTISSPLDGSQGNSGYGNKIWKGHPSSTNGTEQDWTVPFGVTSICILCIGGGAGADGGNSGGGGGLSWINDVPVTPGTVLKVKQGKTGGRNGSGSPSGSDQDGQESYVKDANGDLIIQANPGRKNQSSSGGTGGDTSSNIGTNYQNLTFGGGRGGHGNGGSSGKGGGGGAGGYTGAGGNGGVSCTAGGPGQGGGGGGGGGHCSQDGGQGGGVGIYGKGTDGTGGSPANYAGPGSGGSGGGTGASSYGSWTEETGAFGGGSGAGSGGAGRGAVRIIWGAGRAFPDTNVGQFPSYTHAEYGSFNNANKFKVNQEKGITQWKDTGWTWDQFDSTTQVNGDVHSGNLAYNFRKAEQFFTLVEFTGNGSNQEIAHDLGCEPSMMWIKNRDDDGHSWGVYHKQLDATNPEAYQLFLDTNDKRIASSDIWNNTKPTSSHFSVGNNAHTNASGKKYIAYLFAADQPAFGDSTVDVIATTGTYSGNGTYNNVTLGWEPQMIIIKHTSGPDSGNWILMDKMRLMSMDRGGGAGLDGMQYINLPGSADNTNSFIDFTTYGFQINNNWNGANWNSSGNEYVYYAIRNDIRTEPISATEVFAMDVGNGNYPSMDSGFPVDSGWVKKTNGSNDWNVGFRKSGAYDMKWNDGSTNEGGYSDFKWHSSTAWNWGAYGSDYQSWMFRRAKGFYDVQYWDGDNIAGRQLQHQLGVTPEMIIAKSRSSRNDGWIVYHKDLPTNYYIHVHSSDEAVTGNNVWTAQAPNSSHFILGDYAGVNGSGVEYIGQFYASLDGISKVGSYQVNANGDSVVVDCGFSAGPRMLLVKDTTNAGTDWMLFDTLRGMAEPHATLGEMMDDVPGQKTWTVPAGVTSVSVLCIGGGGGCVLYPSGTTGASGGGGGALAYKNNISVTPGQTITYFVGDGGKGATTQNNNEPDRVISGHYAEGGQPSWFNGTNVNDAVVMGYNGGGAQNYTAGGGGEFSNSTGDGGGSGGNGGANGGQHSWWGFGGGAAGYSGNGGNGAVWEAGSVSGGSGGSGGGAGGGKTWAQLHGTGAFGEGASGALGEAGSGGTNGGSYPTGGQYGGGGTSHGSNAGNDNMSGCTGVVRVVWSTDGTTREFPTTNVQNTDQGYDALLKLNKQDQSVNNTNYFSKTNSGFTVNANTLLSTPNAKYIFLAIA